MQTENRKEYMVLSLVLNSWLFFRALLNCCTMHSLQHPEEPEQRISGKFTYSHFTEQCLLLAKQFPGQTYESGSPEQVLRLGPWNLGSETRGAAQSLGLFKNMKM
jgi:hypothetical protein